MTRRSFFARLLALCGAAAVAPQAKAAPKREVTISFPSRGPAETTTWGSARYLRGDATWTCGHNAVWTTCDGKAFTTDTPVILFKGPPDAH